MQLRSNLATLPSVQGPDATRAVKRIQDLQENKTQWPYPWSYPPPNAKNRLPFGAVAAPAGATPTAIVTFTVPTGFRFYLRGIVRVFFGAGLIEGSGNALWSLTKDTPVGSSQLQGSTLADFINQPFTLGSLEDGPFYFEMPEVFEAGAVIRDVVTTDGTIVSGAPNYFLTLLAGWTVPAE